jgi:hypothetical protein
MASNSPKPAAPARYATVSPGNGRTITVDRQFFDTAEGAHTTDAVKVSVNSITCVEMRSRSTNAGSSTAG